MVVDLTHVTAVAVAPNGKAVAYTLEVPRKSEDEPGDSYSELWVADLESGTTRHFAGNSEEVSSPSWSPDGESITFRVEREKVFKGTQIYSIPADGGEARLLTRHPGNVSNYRWSPDGKWIAFAAKAADSDERAKEKEAGQDWVVWGSEDKHRQLFLLEVATGASRRLFDTDLDAFEVHWTPDSAELLFQATTTARIDDEYMFTRIYRAPAAGGNEPSIVVSTEGKLGHMAISPDGKHLAYLGATSLNDPVAGSLFVLPLSGGTPRNLTGDREASAANLAWKDNDTIALLSVAGERHALETVDVASGRHVPDTLDDLVARQFEYSTKSGVIALAAETPAHPAELFVRGAKDAKFRRLSSHNPVLDGVRLARQEVASWKGADGWDIRGILTYPLDYQEGTRYPLVLQVHGGPEGVSLDGWTTSSGYPVQVLAANGFAVLQPNYRGSSGRGVAFSKADHDDLGGAEFEDILTGIDALVARGLVDGNRVGTGGWSYGGYMSAWAATRHSERFQASVVAAGLTNWIAFAGSTDIPYEMSLVHWNSWWFDQPELHWQRSPLAHINQAQTPTLVVTGAEDKRVHPEQAMELHTALRIKGIPTEMVFYPREPHGLDERAHRLDFIGRTLGWFEKYLSAPEIEAMEEPKN
jgi:dipeptidyl aminopeptidase/acylaminoacyl peptidase